MEVTPEIKRDIDIISITTALVPRLIDNYFLGVPGMNTCILSTRVGLEVLRAFQVRARAVPVRVGIFNEPMVTRIGKEGRFPREGEVLKWNKEDGSWGLGIGETGRVEEGRFDGHMVLLAHGRVLVDLSIQQSNRPLRKIVLEPFAFTVGDGFLEGEQQTVVLNRCTLRYDYFPEAEGWQMTPDWREVDRRQPIVDAVIRNIKLELDDEG